MALPSFEVIIQDLFKFFVNTFGGLGVVASVFVLIFAMIFQSIIAPIASEAVLASSGGILYKAFGIPGIYAAIIGGVIGSMLGAYYAFYISNWIQKQFKNRLVDDYKEQNLNEMKSRKDRFLFRASKFLARFIDEDSEDFIEVIEERGFLIVLIGRILVFVPFDAVSYAAGLTKIKLKDFMIATFIGSIPRVIFYVLLGTQLANALTGNFTLFVAIFVGFAGAIYGLYKFIMNYLQKQNSSEETEGEKIMKEFLDEKEAIPEPAATSEQA